MEDEDVDLVNKINATSVSDSLSSDVPISKEINNKVIINENDVYSPDKEEKKEESCGLVTLTKLKSLTNHEKHDVDKNSKFEETDRHSCTESADSLDCNNSSCITKKVNGEIIKSGSCVSEEEFSGGVSEEGVESIKEIKEVNIVDSVEHCNTRKRPLSNVSDDSNQSGDDYDKDSSSSSPTEFRGFKKRKTSDEEKLILLEKEKQFEGDISCINNDIVEKPKVELRRSARNASIAKRKMVETAVETKEESEDQLTEYAQYLGLQPTVKFKCGRCGEKHFQSMASLNAHQSACCNKNSSNVLVKPSKPSGDSNLSTNFRITRKVYLCSACGTYYENWKLFLHMRDMHKRHICLFCLGMFSVADKLAEHLLFKHNVHEKTCKSPEEFLNLFKGSCYLTCCSCEKMFTEREDFFDHLCKEVTTPLSTVSKDSTVSSVKDSAQRCNLCGVKCGHFQNCPNFSNNKIQNSSSTSPINKNSNSNQNLSLTKYYIPVPASVQKGWSNTVNTSSNENPGTQEKDDYYDIGNAASFCHVDIVNDDTQSTPDKKNVDHKTYSRVDNRQKSLAKLSDNKESTTDEGKNTTDSSKSTANLGDNEKTFIKNNEKVLERSESCDNENNITSNSEHQNSENENMNDADDEENSSDDSSINQQKHDTKEVDNNTCLEEKSVDIRNDADLRPTNNSNSVTSCYIKLDRLDDELLKNDSTGNTSENDDIGRISKEIVNENNCNSSSNEADKLNSSNTESNSNVINATSNSPNSSSTTDNDQELIELDESENKNKSLDDVNSGKEKILDDDSLDNRISSHLSEENSFETKHCKELVDKSEESEDSDKLSVILSDDDNDDDNYEKCSENKTKENISNVEQQRGDLESNKSVEDVSKTSDNEMLEHTDNCDNDNNGNGADEEEEEEDDGDDEEDNDNDSNDDEEEEEEEEEDESGENTLQNGDETTDDNTRESQNKSQVSCKETVVKSDGDKIPLASEEVMAMALTLEDRIDNLSSQFVIKECVRTSCTTCSYCSHAIKIAVNGKQLALHLLAEHRYMPVKNETVEDVIERLKKSLDELQDVWFNTDSYDSSDKSCFVPYDHTYECFQCNYVTNLHKDLYTHKRKVHQKTILYCSMCKANFYSYSELLCHMCPGVYVSKDIQFRCSFCELDRIPSAFRLMVHLRKSHHSCDMCLEMAGDQQKLSTHMWKHKLHHLCYRCGIAYRNKPDITKHLFWKHGTESVLCKKCLQKKWPHVYHFCIPPTVFICEECNFSFSKAVALKVHKRMHAGDFPYSCNTCEQKFISKKLLLKHEKSHNDIPVEDSSKIDVLSVSNEEHKNDIENPVAVEEPSVDAPQESTSNVQTEFEKSKDSVVKTHKKKSKKDRERKLKQVVDVYDLPPLNLSSESDDSDDDKEAKMLSLQSNNKETHLPVRNNDVVHDKIEKKIEDVVTSSDIVYSEEREETNVNSKGNDISTESGGDVEENPQPVTVVDGIWDNFHSYKAEQEKRENLDISNKQSNVTSPNIPKDAVLGDHDYCIPNGANDHTGDENMDIDKSTNREHSSSIDHDYCSLNNSEGNNLLQVSNQDKTITDTPSKKKQKSPKKKVLKQHNSSSSSDTSSDSDSSSCSCGTNCSCSSSSSNSSSSSSSDSDSSSSEGRHHNSTKREKKKEKLKNKRKDDAVVKPTEPPPVPEEEPVIDLPIEPDEPLIKESDLETDESTTDEEFYDQYPQRHANQLLAEKRNQLMVLAAVAPVNNGTASPPVSSSNVPPPIETTPSSTPVLPSTSTVSSSNTATTLQSRKRVKSKKRKKSSQLDNSTNSRTARSQNILYESSQPSTSFSSSRGKQNVTDITYRTTSSSLIATPLPNQSLINNSNTFLSNQQQQPSSESHSKRLSKRRRVRNKFYGYSSEEEDEHAAQHHPPPSKWKKTDANSQQNILLQQQPHHQQQPPQQVPHHLPLVLPPEYSFQPKIPQQPVRVMEDNRITINVSEGLTKRVSSSDSSNSSEVDSESDTDRLTVNPVVTNATGATTSEKDDKLYCYCQCPYDEVSEMIACDGVDCTIEWFHFECVGIMVPPKGKWYCPDCRKRRGLS